MSLRATFWIMAKRVLSLALLGAIVGGIAGWLMYGEWGIIMAPTFALIGAIMGVLNALLFSTRIIVPKRVSSFGYTINLGRPIGLAIAIALIAVLVGIIITSAFGH